jgi:hypothetical protein
MVGSCEHGDEPLGFIKQCKFLEKLQDCWLLQKGSAALNKSVSQLVIEVLDYFVTLSVKSRVTRS